MSSMFESHGETHVGNRFLHEPLPQQCGESSCQWEVFSPFRHHYCFPYNGLQVEGKSLRERYRTWYLVIGKSQVGFKVYQPVGLDVYRCRRLYDDVLRSQ